MTKDSTLKSLFILPAVAVSALILVGAVVMAAISWQERVAWIGVAVAALPLPLLVARLAFLPLPRTSDALPLVLLVAAAGAFVPIWQMVYEGAAGWAPVSAAAAAVVLLLLYDFWYSRYGRYPDARLDVAAKLPEFELTDLEGNTVRSTDVLGRPAAFLFYRGSWCPICMAQLDELAERRDEMERLGMTVCLISPQPEAHTRRLAEKFGGPFRFFVDKDNRAAGELQIAVKNGVPVGLRGDYGSDTVMPTLFVTSANGTIVFSDQTDNYRVRPEPDIFIAILRRAGAGRK